MEIIVLEIILSFIPEAAPSPRYATPGEFDILCITVVFHRQVFTPLLTLIIRTRIFWSYAVIKMLIENLYTYMNFYINYSLSNVQEKKNRYEYIFFRG